MPLAGHGDVQSWTVPRQSCLILPRHSVVERGAGRLLPPCLLASWLDAVGRACAGLRIGPCHTKQWPFASASAPHKTWASCRRNVWMRSGEGRRCWSGWECRLWNWLRRSGCGGGHFGIGWDIANSCLRWWAKEQERYPSWWFVCVSVLVGCRCRLAAAGRRVEQRCLGLVWACGGEGRPRRRQAVGVAP